MAFGYTLVALLAATLAVFALQNTEPTSIKFIVWSMDAMPVSALIFLALAVGIVIAGVPLWIQRWRLRSRIRALEARIAQLERAATERDAAERDRPRGDAATGS